MVGQGDDEVEALAVEIWVDDLPIRIVTTYGPQVGDSVERKLKFWNFIEREANNASESGSGFILQMDSNANLGKEVIKEHPNDQNYNRKLFCNFLERMSHLTIVNALPVCEGLITRMRKSSRGVEMSILYVFLTCDQILPYIKRMVIDEKREHSLTNFSTMKNLGRVIESDHNVEILEVDLSYSEMKQDRIEMFDFKNKKSQTVFKNLTSSTSDFSR